MQEIETPSSSMLGAPCVNFDETRAALVFFECWPYAEDGKKGNSVDSKG